MATYKHLRSSTANKRPTTSIADGQLAINTNTASPGLFFKDSAGTGIVKVGPVHVGTTAPNSVPASGGSTGNYLGEQWLDTSVSPAQMKVWNGSAWIGVVADELPVSKLQDGSARQLLQTDAAGTGVEWTSNVDVPGTLDVSSTATFDSIASHPLGSAGAPTITFTGDTNTGIYSPGADQVAISTNGTGRLSVDASGNTVVGPTSARAQLHVYGTGQTTSNLTDAGGRGGILRVSDSGTTAGAGGAIAFANVQGDGANSVGFAAIKGLLTDGTNNTAGDLAFATRATSAATSLQERLRITSDGKVGLGTSSVDAKFQINVGDGFRFDVGANAYSYMRFGSAVSAEGTAELGFERTTGSVYIKSGSTGSTLSNLLTIDATGRVGVGTTSPSTIVHCVGGASGVDTRITVGNNGASLQAGVDGSDFCFLGTNQNQPLYFLTNGTERARIDSSGRLLVGTSTAFTTLSALTAKLQVQGTSVFDTGITNALWESSSNPAQLQLVKSRGASIGTQTVVQNNDNLGRILFGGSDGTDFETAAWIQCDVDGTPGANDMPGRLVFSTTADGASSPTERMRIDKDGATLIGTQSLNGTQGLTINPNITEGSAQIVFNRATTTNTSFCTLFKNAGTDVGSISYTNTATAFNTSSDYRLKENVVAVSDGITRVQQLKPSRFNFIVDPTKTVDGFLAHEVQDIVPEAITGEKDAVDADGNPKYQGIDQSKLVPLLTAALQEAIAKIESLEARLTAAGI